MRRQSDPELGSHGSLIAFWSDCVYVRISPDSVTFPLLAIFPKRDPARRALSEPAFAR